MVPIQETKEDFSQTEMELLTSASTWLKTKTPDSLKASKNTTLPLSLTRTSKTRRAIWLIIRLWALLLKFIADIRIAVSFSNNRTKAELGMFLHKRKKAERDFLSLSRTLLNYKIIILETLSMRNRYNLIWINSLIVHLILEGRKN